MQLEIIVDGNSYFGSIINADKKVLDETALTIYEVVDKISKFQAELIDGSILILSPDAIKKSVFVIHSNQK